MRIFELKPGDVFTLSGGTFTVRRFLYRRLNKLGRVLHCEVTTEKMERQYFISNWEVERKEAHATDT